MWSMQFCKCFEWCFEAAHAQLHCFQASLPLAMALTVLGTSLVAASSFLHFLQCTMTQYKNGRKTPLIFRVLCFFFFFSKNIWKREEINYSQDQESQYYGTHSHLKPSHIQFICPRAQRDLSRLIQCLQQGFKLKQFFILNLLENKKMSSHLEFLNFTFKLS